MNKVKDFFDKYSKYIDDSEHDFVLVKKLLDELDINKDDRVLDLGCGKGVITNLLTSYSPFVVGQDLSTNMIKRARKEKPDLTFKEEDFYKSNEVFDYIVIFDAYPHFLDLPSFKESLYRCLSLKGRVAIVHDCSKEMLDLFHKGEVKAISRSLYDVKKESSFYLDLFDVVKAKEDDSSYLIVLKKKD